MKTWLARLAPALVLALCQLPLTAQGPSQNGSWADEIIKKESYATPPPELADAVLAPRHLNVSLSSLSPDQKWFLDEIGDGPVLMKTFAKPFHELGGVFIDYRANRARSLTIRNKTGTKTRLYESDNHNVYERVSSILDPDAGTFIVTRESPREVPQQFLVRGGQRVQLTKNRDVTPDLTNMKVERFTVERPDGFTFRVTVNLPQDFTPGTKPPALFWFYPREFQNQESYDRPDRTFNKNSFQNFGVRSMEFFTRLGYAVVEPDAPIVGTAGAMNDNYVHDLRNNLAAVIDELDRRGLADRNRLGIGGHSYGAFSTVNAMVHTPYFKAGIAGDGAYNRTLTPLMYPLEDHGPASRETLLDLWARWAAWLDKYVKNPQKAEPVKKITTDSASR